MATRTQRNDAVRGRKDGREPQRRCIVTGASQPTAEMVRFVLDPDGIVRPDVAGSLPGRGFWLSAERDKVKTACAKNMFARAARGGRAVREKIKAPDDLDVQVEALLVRRCLDLLGLGRRAGQIAAGYEKVRARVADGTVGVVLQASDAAENGRSKGRSLAKTLPVIDLFTGAELGNAVGREFVVHVAMDTGRLADRFMAETRRLRGFRDSDADQSAKTGR